MRKGEIAHNEQFLQFQQCFLSFGELSNNFIKLISLKIYSKRKQFLKMTEFGNFSFKMYERL